MRIKTILKSFLALPLLLTVVSCQDKLKTGFAKGEAVKFSIGTDAAGTKAAYSGQATDNIERIDWQEGDLIRIYCGQVSEPSDKFADYRVTSDITAGGSNSTAHIEGTGGVCLRWGEGNHTFYAAYPSPASSGITTGISAEKVSANLPASQFVVGGVTETSPGSGNYVAAPDLKNMLMTAKSAEYSPETGITDDVFLSFTPLSTAIKFTIENGTGAELALTDVQLISGNGKASADVISGAFSVDLDQTGITAGTEVQPFSGNDFKITYNRDYPLCTSAVPTSPDMADRTLTISVGTDANPLRLAVDKELTFTFFLNPCHHFDDLTFKLVKAGGAWMSTRLGYTDGDGVFFPRHKKSTVKGILVPEGAQWTVKYAPGVEPWNTVGGDIDPTPEVSGEPIVTSWDTGKENEKLKFENSHGAVYIGGKWWATMNVGATTVAGNPATCYGDYFAWGETEPYYSQKTISETGTVTFIWKTTPKDYKTKGYGSDYDNYKWGKPGGSGFTKYNNSDGKIVLDAEDDAVTHNWGPSWRMPTEEDFMALLYACTGSTGSESLTPSTLSSKNPEGGVYWLSDDQTILMEYNGVAGCLFVDRSDPDKRVFFPAAGDISGTNCNNVGSSCFYWSRTRNTNDPCGVFRLKLNNSSIELKYNESRYNGFHIRPVHD